MKIRSIFKLWYVLICLLVVLISSWIVSDRPQVIELPLTESSITESTPASLRLYYTIEKYSEEYGIPKHIAYNIAFKETRFLGPFDWQYDPFVASSAGAVGAMQIKPSTASGVYGKSVDKKNLTTDIDLNVSLALQFLHQLYIRFDSWELACGYYNTGKPIRNDYSKYCVTNKDYINNWVYYRKQ